MGVGPLQRLGVCWFIALSLLCYALPVVASIRCYDCHGTRSPVDYRPVDAPYRNITSGGFQGSHHSHMPATAGPSSCTHCHSNSDGYTASHRQGRIKLSANINSSPLAALYRNTSSAFPQTPNPTFGSCSNVNCHFEAVTPIWCTTAFVAPNDCNRCHGLPPNDGSHLRHDGYYGPGALSCTKCHTDHMSETIPFAHATSAGKRGIIFNPALSPGLVYSKAGNFSYPNYLPSQTPAASRNGSCNSISCHSATAAQWGSTSCLGCHSVAQGGRAAIAAQFGANSHHVQGTLSDASCYQCHWEANSDGSINPAYHHGGKSPGASVELVIYGAGSRPSVYTPGVTAVQYLADGSRSEIAKVTSHCLGCHSDQNNSSQPFGDGKTPRQYAWDNSSVAARYSQTGTTTWGKYSTVTNAAQKRIAKSYSAHGNASANKRGWDTVNGVDGAIIDTSGSSNVQCFDCHNSHGSTVSGTTTRYASATVNGGILKDTTVERSGAAVAYKPYSAGRVADKNLRNPGASLCLDCHMNQNAVTTPWGYNSTYGAGQQILGYWDSPFMSYSGAGAKKRYSYKGENLIKGGHFGASTPLSTNAMAGIGGLCTPCHDPHGVSPTIGSNQQYAVPLLKGTYLTSPYREDVAPVNNWGQTTFNEITYHIDQNTFGSRIDDAVSGIVENDSQFAGLCLQCHGKSSLTNGSNHSWKSKDRIHETVKGWKTANGTIKHNYSCSKCHSVHTSSVLPRLMVTNCMDARHKGRVGLNLAPVVSSSGSGDVGAGSGRIPGSYTSYGDTSPGTYQPTCHENNTGSGTDQSWNSVTPWAAEQAMTITGGPTSELRTTSYLTGVWWTFLWSTNIPGSTIVEFGLTSAYGSINTEPSLVQNHVGVVKNLLNHTTYHYRVKSISYTGKSAVSSDFTFYTSAPPTVPVPIVHANSTCVSSCSETLQWNAAMDIPDNGPIEYNVQVSTDSSFASAVQSSGWISTTSWSPVLATNNSWYWRVQSRDANHTTAQDPTSGWSATQSFIMIDGAPPLAPTQLLPASGSAVLSDTQLQWNSVSGPVIEYQAEYSTDPTFATGVVASGWITNTYFFPYPGPGSYYWRVQARNGISLATSPYSPVWSFSVSDGCYGDSCCLYGCSTCPTLYSWNGESYAFETDTFPTGFLGTKTPTGFRKPNPFEYHLLESGPQLKDGFYSLKIVEERDETDYFDSLKLFAVDYPADLDLFQELRTNGTYSAPAAMLHTVARTLKRPVSITHLNSGADVSARLAASDQDYLVLNNDRNLDFNWQTLEIDLGDQSQAPQIKLIIDAQTVVPTTSAGMARKDLLSLNGKITKLEVQDGSGNWVLVPYAIKEVYSPKERGNAYLVDITNIFRIYNINSFKFRLSFLYKVYLDALYFDTTADQPVTLTELPLQSAELGYYGFSRKTDGELFDYIYGDIVTRGTSYFSGAYTRYGDVTPLLTQTDDKFVIFAGGEELSVRFAADAAVPEGKARKYLLYANGYYKATGNTNITHTVLPLPFAAMSNFPYNTAVENYPADAGHQQYQQDYNTRVVVP